MVKKSIRVIPAIGILGLVLARVFRRLRHEPKHTPLYRRLVPH